MNFGIASYDGLSKQDFVFPEMEQSLLSGQKAAFPKLYIGLPKWGRTEWIGTLYPPKIKEKEYLNYYVQHFNSIELNATHYKVHPEAVIKNWVDKVGGKDFIFCPKMYQGITHRGNLSGKEFVTNEFFRSIEGFGKHLGPVFIQISETYSPKRKEELFDFLRTLPNRFKYFLEVRHEKWFSSKEEVDELSKSLRDMNIGFVITDTPNRRDVVHMNLTIPQAFVRFGCFGDNDLDKYRIEQWKQQLQQWFQNGLESCYFFLHIQNEEKVVDFAKYVQSELQPLVK